MCCFNNNNCGFFNGCCGNGCGNNRTNGCGNRRGNSCGNCFGGNRGFGFNRCQEEREEREDRFNRCGREDRDDRGNRCGREDRGDRGDRDNRCGREDREDRDDRDNRCGREDREDRGDRDNRCGREDREDRGDRDNRCDGEEREEREGISGVREGLRQHREDSDCGFIPFPCTDTNLCCSSIQQLNAALPSIITGWRGGTFTAVITFADGTSLTGITALNSYVNGYLAVRTAAGAQLINVQQIRNIAITSTGTPPIITYNPKIQPAPNEVQLLKSLVPGVTYTVLNVTGTPITGVLVRKNPGLYEFRTTGTGTTTTTNYLTYCGINGFS